MQGYLSIEHITFKNSPCTLAFLATDLASREPKIRNTYTRIYQGMNKVLAKYTKSYSNCSEQTIFAVTAMLIGGVAISRVSDDSNTVEQVLNSCQQVAQQLFDDH